jgi:transposase
MLACDLGSTKWTLGFATAPAQRPRIRTMPAGDLVTLVQEIPLAKARLGLPLGAPVRRCSDAGREGFWLHRWLLAHEVENVVVEASSLEVNRRARRAPTDRLDVGKWLALLL